MTADHGNSADRGELVIRYVFSLPEQRRETFILRLDPENLETRNPGPEPPPAWTALAFHQCGACPLSPDEQPTCPLALSLAPLIQPFNRLLSYDRLGVEVITAERRLTQETTAQQGISALMGLVIATSGCPHTAYFRPMARFHLPLASEPETIYRATSMYLLAQYFIRQAGGEADLKLNGLTAIYKNLHLLNVSVARRLREASETDSLVNAIVLLDTFAKTLPMAIKESLVEIRHLFKPFLDG